MNGFSGYRKSSPNKSRSAFKQDPPPSDDNFTIGEAEDVFRRGQRGMFNTASKPRYYSSQDYNPNEYVDAYSQDPRISKHFNDRRAKAEAEGGPKWGGMEIDPYLGNLVRQELKKHSKNKHLSPTQVNLYKEINRSMQRENEGMGSEPIYLGYRESDKGTDWIGNISMSTPSATSGIEGSQTVGYIDDRNSPDTYGKYTTADLDQLNQWKKQLAAGQGYRPPVGSLDKLGPDQLPTDDPSLSQLPRRPEVPISLPTMEPETIPTNFNPETMDQSRELTGTAEAEFPQINFNASDRQSLINQLKNAPMGSKLREQLYNDLNWAQDHTTTGYKGPQSNLGKMGEVRGTTPPPPSSKNIVKPTNQEAPKLTPKPKPTAPNLQKNMSQPQKGKQTYSSVTERGKAVRAKQQEKTNKRKQQREAKKKQRLKNRGGQKFHIADLGLEIKEGLDSIFGGV